MTVTSTPLTRLRPDAAAAFAAALHRAGADDPLVLLPVCRARIRVLLGGPADPEAVPRTELEELAVEFAEQYVLDVAGMPDVLVGMLRDRLGAEGLYAFAMGLYAIDQAERLALTSGVHPGAAR